MNRKKLPKEFADFWYSKKPIPPIKPTESQANVEQGEQWKKFLDTIHTSIDKNFHLK